MYFNIQFLYFLPRIIGNINKSRTLESLLIQFEFATLQELEHLFLSIIHTPLPRFFRKIIFLVINV